MGEDYWKVLYEGKKLKGLQIHIYTVRSSLKTIASYKGNSKKRNRIEKNFRSFKESFNVLEWGWGEVFKILNYLVFS